MKLLTEIHDIETLIEQNEAGPKQYFIEGIFMQSDIKNRNGRIYPQSVTNAQVERYQTVINERKSTGELGHPSNPSVNLDRISHRITELRVDGKNVYGKAKILDTPMGKIAKALIDDDIQLGVSSRGLGSLKESRDGKIVQSDFILTTVDIVSDPSAHDAWVQNIVEETDWIFDGVEWRRREIIQTEIEKFKRESSALREERFLQLWKKLL